MQKYVLVVPALKNRGVAYLGKQQWDRAIEGYNEAIRLEPEYADEDYSEAIRLNFDN